MIEFNGYISGTAQEFFLKKSRKILQKLILFAVILLLPIFCIIAYQTKYWLLLGTYCTLIMAVLLFLRIPKRVKNLQNVLPKKIYTDEEYIVCVADQYVEHRKISDVKQVIDHGEFYELIFPLGKISDKFICQKSLLVKGTLASFENMFEVDVLKK